MKLLPAGMRFFLEAALGELEAFDQDRTTDGARPRGLARVARRRAAELGVARDLRPPLAPPGLDP